MHPITEILVALAALAYTAEVVRSFLPRNTMEGRHQNEGEGEPLVIVRRADG